MLYNHYPELVMQHLVQASFLTAVEAYTFCWCSQKTSDAAELLPSHRLFCMELLVYLFFFEDFLDFLLLLADVFLVEFFDFLLSYLLLFFEPFLSFGTFNFWPI